MKRIFEAVTYGAALLAGEALAEYEYGEDCQTLSDQFCQQTDCLSCKFSWPKGESWTHPDAACRC